jgi:endonuclease/exonuclease/phosphatase (EEP) superfamily protein YafD
VQGAFPFYYAFEFTLDVFYKPAEALRVVESKVNEELTASDHRPVLTVFELA